MPRKIFKIFLSLILFLFSVPSAIAMNSEHSFGGRRMRTIPYVKSAQNLPKDTKSGEKPAALSLTEVREENAPPTRQISRSKLAPDDLDNIVKKLSTTTLEKSEARLIINAARLAAGIEKNNKRQRTISITMPENPPKHARIKTSIGNHGTFYGSGTPIKKKSSPKNKNGKKMVERNISERAIYSWVMVKEHNELYIAPQDLIDVEEFLNPELEYDDDDINSALLKTELQLRKWIRDMDDFVFKTVYVGLSENADSRVTGHKYDLQNHENTMARKNTFADLVGDAGYNLRMRPLLHHVPTELLSLFECLVAKLLSSKICSASSIIGNKASWARLNDYWNSDKRIEEIKKAGLDGIAENKSEQIFIRAKLMDLSKD